MGFKSEFNYTVAGLRVSLNQRTALSENEFADRVLEITFSGDSEPTHTDWIRLADDERTTLYFHANGERATIHGQPESHEQLTAMVRRTASLAAALQGRPLLHASAVEYQGATLAVVGGSGVGKSTLARHLAGDGLPLLTDDLLPYRYHHDRAYVPIIDMACDTIRWLPMSIVCFLERHRNASGPEWIPLSPLDAFRRFTSNAFGELHHARNWTHQFTHSHRLAVRVRSYILKVPDEHSLLARTAQRICTDLSAITASPVTRNFELA